MGEGGGGGAGPRPGARGSALPALLLQVLIREVAEKEVRAAAVRRVLPPRGRPWAAAPPLPPPLGRGARGLGSPPGRGAGGGGARAGWGRGARLTGRPLPAAAASTHRLDREGASQDLPESGETFTSRSKETFPRVE